ncbi:hypothetical protein [Phocaeicola sp.]
MRINFKSDFKILEKNLDGDITTPFKFLYSSFGIPFIAAFDGKTYTNCKRLEDRSLLVIFDKHNLSPGRLRVERKYFLSDSDFADGICNIVSVEDTGIILVAGKSDGDTVTTVPYSDYVAYKAVQCESISDYEFEDVLEGFEYSPPIVSRVLKEDENDDNLN